MKVETSSARIDVVFLSKNFFAVKGVAVHDSWIYYFHMIHK